MTEPTIDVRGDVSGTAYNELLEFLRERSASFSLVWPNNPTVPMPDAEQIAQDLAPALLREENRANWPGTELIDAFVTVRFYTLTDSSLAILRESGHLYAWQAPGAPDDLAFYASDGKLVFGSTAHERDAWFNPAVVSIDEVRAAMPSLRVAGV